MKRLGLSLILLIVLIDLSGCSGKPINNLKDNLDDYKECMINNNFECQMKFIDISALEKFTGVKVDTDILVEELKSTGVRVTNIQMNEPSKIVKNGNFLSSSILYSMTAIVKGQEIKTKALLKAVSYDNGSTWFFSQDL